MNSADSMQGNSSDQPQHPCPQVPGSPGSKFSIMYFNSRSMLPKFDEPVALYSSYKPDIICLVETWLCEDVLDSEIHVSNYSILKLDRNRHGGGVALYIHNSIMYNVLLCGQAGLELIVVSLSRTNFKLCIGVFYRPTSSSPAMFTCCVTLYFSMYINLTFLSLQLLATLMLTSLALTLCTLTSLTS